MREAQIPQAKYQRVKQFAGWLMQSRQRSMLATLIFAATPMLSWFAGTMVGLVTLHISELEGFIFMAIASIPSIAIAIYFHTPSLILESICMNFLPVWVFALVLRRTNSWSWVVQAASILGMLGLAVFYFVVNDPIAFWTTHLAPMQHAMLTDPKNTMDAANIKALFSVLAESSSVLIALGICINGIVGLLFARWVQSLLFNPTGFSKEVLKIQVSWLSLGCLLVTVAYSFMHTHLAEDLFVLALVPFISAGLSLVHFLFRQRKLNKIWILCFYCISIFYIIWSSTLLAIVATVDRFYDLRHMMAKSKN